MFDTQVARLMASYPIEFNRESASNAVARAYGYRQLDMQAIELSDPYPGLQFVKAYQDMLKLDPVHQLMEFMRMALNLSLSHRDEVRQGIPERNIVAAMMGFSNFDALITYSRSEPVDPNTTDRSMLAKFKVRYAYYAPIQYVLGRYIYEHCFIIQPDTVKARRFIDQELTLNPLQKTKVVVLRDDSSGADWLSIMSKSTATYSGRLDDAYDKNAAKALGKTEVLVSLLPAEEYLLSNLVKAHVDLLVRDSPEGRALIVDGLKLSFDTQDLDDAFALATAQGIHIVVVAREPNAEIWKRTGIHLIFGFDQNMKESYPDMDKYIGYASTYVGFKRGKMQYLYQSEESGPRFAAMDLIPDDPKTKSLLQRMKDALRGKSSAEG
ncbi:hypothetical protein [Pseudomonas syringae]|uniref:hypothetical protein n=1 Tax=Pseudomonas syringae TaxID=317 RepID=UPI001F334382|nr:hypothetical protein [Pseudomonas syringae]MCF5371278.1 hypothetical protein [Pseudomonas syringae]